MFCHRGYPVAAVMGTDAAIRINKKRRKIFCLLKSILMVFSNRTKTVTASVFLWAARDISCEAPSVGEEAEEDLVKSFGAWYKSRKQTNVLALRIKDPM